MTHCCSTTTRRGTCSLLARTFQHLACRAGRGSAVFSRFKQPRVVTPCAPNRCGLPVPRLVLPPAAVDPDAVHEQPATVDGAVAAIIGWIRHIIEYSVAALGRLASGRPGIACESDGRHRKDRACAFVVWKKHWPNDRADLVSRLWSGSCRSLQLYVSCVTAVAVKSSNHLPNADSHFCL